MVHHYCHSSPLITMQPSSNHISSSHFFTSGFPSLSKYPYLTRLFSCLSCSFSIAYSSPMCLLSCLSILYAFNTPCLSSFSSFSSFFTSSISDLFLLYFEDPFRRNADLPFTSSMCLNGYYILLKFLLYLYSIGNSCQ